MSVPLPVWAEIETPDGVRFPWNHDHADPGSRLRNIQITTKIGEGFSTLTGTLARRIDRDYPDLNLGNRITVVGSDGFVLFEGRLSAMPRELGQAHQINVTFVGHMANTKDRKFSEAYVDRETSGWAGIPLDERSRLATAAIDFGSFSWSSENGSLVAALPNQALGTFVTSSAWNIYPSGVEIAKIQYQGSETSIPVGYTRSFRGHNQDNYDGGTSEVQTATFDGTLRSITLGTPRRYVDVELFSAGTAATPAAGASARLDKLATYGNHGLDLYTGEAGEPQGVYASDVIRDVVGRWCPSLNTAGVEDTTYVIQHLKFDRQFPYDALLEVNKFHLWHLGVWEDRTLHFRPYDLSEYDWEIRTDDNGTTFNPAGPTVDDLFNGIEVTYTDVLTGRTETLSPDDHDELVDTSTENPWNQWGEQHWDEIALSSPTVEAQALEIGRAALADKNRPKTAGTITVQGHIRDAAGHLQPVANVRAGDVICVTNFNEINRLIVETSYDNETKTVSLAIDFPFQTLEALFDRMSSAALARGL